MFANSETNFRMMARLFRLVILIACCALSDGYHISYKVVYQPKALVLGPRHSTLRYLKTQQESADAEPSEATKSARQLLGIKGASENKNIWAIRLQLAKPVTWIPLIWGVACGAAASGNYHSWNPFTANNAPVSLMVEDALKALACMILAGPILTGYTQTLNDWEDRKIDAINEPYRPIPSGAISEGQVFAQIYGLLASGLALSYGLDKWAGHTNPIIFLLTVFGTFISYIYSAPPLKLKATGWMGSFALGSSYISLPWLCGQAMFGQLSWPVTMLTIFYSLAGLGIAIVNDFKSIEGDRYKPAYYNVLNPVVDTVFAILNLCADLYISSCTYVCCRAMGLQSLPVAFGIDTAKWLTVAMIDLTQLCVAAYLFFIGEPTHAAVLLGLIAPQMYFQWKYFLPDPVKNDVKYQASAQPFLVLGILATALAVGRHGPL